MPAGRSTSSLARSAFTIVEAIAVVVVLSVLAAVVIGPALSMNGLRQTSAAEEIASTFVLARARAMTAGEACAVRVDPSADSFDVVTLQGAPAAPEVATGPLGEPIPALLLSQLFRGVAVSAVTHGDGSTGAGLCWFDHDGAPMLRDGNHDDAGLATSDALITLNSGHVVRVRRLSGQIVTETP